MAFLSPYILVDRKVAVNGELAALLLLKDVLPRTAEVRGRHFHL